MYGMNIKDSTTTKNTATTTSHGSSCPANKSQASKAEIKNSVKLKGGS
jgi:hypothetical protein